MTKRATTLDEQISLLRSRGVEISSDEKAKEYLLDIGYYRLCSYLFPFEKTYPKLSNRTHEVIEGTRLSDAVALYYFDFDLRNILNRYLSRIEVALRTYITYTFSNKYKDSPCWFVNPQVVSSSYIKGFNNMVYKAIRKQPIIIRHHKKYPRDKYAPAWKTLEFMTFGNIEFLYLNLKSLDDKLDICRYFGVNQTAIFENYVKTVRSFRNTCAHGGILFDIKLSEAIKNGPAGHFIEYDKNNLYGALKVIEFFLERISTNRLTEMRRKINKALSALYKLSPKLELTIKKTAGLLQYKKSSYICDKFSARIPFVDILCTLKRRKSGLNHCR